MNCPDCHKPMREVFQGSKDGVRRFVCDIAMKGLMLGKTGQGFVHKNAWVYKVKHTQE